jgi:hypothetical protein
MNTTVHIVAKIRLFEREREREREASIYYGEMMAY